MLGTARDESSQVFRIIATFLTLQGRSQGMEGTVPITLCSLKGSSGLHVLAIETEITEADLSRRRDRRAWRAPSRLAGRAVRASSVTQSTAPVSSLPVLSRWRSVRQGTMKAAQELHDTAKVALHGGHAMLKSGQPRACQVIMALQGSGAPLRLKIRTLNALAALTLSRHWSCRLAAQVFLAPGQLWPRHGTSTPLFPLSEAARRSGRSGRFAPHHGALLGGTSVLDEKGANLVTKGDTHASAWWREVQWSTHTPGRTERILSTTIGLNLPTLPPKLRKELLDLVGPDINRPTSDTPHAGRSFATKGTSGLTSLLLGNANAHASATNGKTARTCKVTSHVKSSWQVPLSLA